MIRTRWPATAHRIMNTNMYLNKTFPESSRFGCGSRTTQIKASTLRSNLDLKSTLSPILQKPSSPESNINCTLVQKNMSVFGLPLADSKKQKTVCSHSKPSLYKGIFPILKTMNSLLSLWMLDRRQ